MFKEASEINEKISWQDMTTGCEIYEPGTSRLTKTGEWRSRKPKWIKNRCKQCLLCVPFCPDSSIPVSEDKREDFDYDHCKGCGICIKACPFSAIEFEEPDTVSDRSLVGYGIGIRTKSDIEKLHSTEEERS